ncbi:hypothetical protein [Nonomuraea sp. NPDC050202]|uniref:hypothetical protein n=1 Tax=Nonomuraea sp. NPDC050202 TaxID=3155035 RepID=UPI0033E7DD41
MATLAERLDEALRERGLSDRKTAKLLREQGVTVTHAYIGQLRKGTAENPSLVILTGLARFLGKSLDWLVGVEEQPDEGPLTPEEAAQVARMEDKAMALKMRNVAKRLTGLKDSASLDAVEQMLDTMLSVEERHRQRERERDEI